jgi:2-oxo-3-(phosphooxy)propyl 3-oxoalkanoate synthase
MVHKTTAGHVLLTDGIRLAHDRFLLAAMLPADHGLYHPDGEGRTDPMLLVEALRQAGYYISHRFYGVPDTHKFIFGGVTLKAVGTAPPAVDASWLPVNLRVTCTPTAKWTRRRLGMRLEVESSVAGRLCGHGSVLSEAVDTRIYQAVRRRTASSKPAGPAPGSGRPLLPGDVGRRSPADVLLADDGLAEDWLLRVDQGHPVMFDHPVDHVPGMVLLEAFRQAALVAARRRAGRRASLIGLRTEFARFCELDVPTRITARLQRGHPVADRRLVQVAAEQAGAHVASGAMELRLDAGANKGASR